MYTSVIVLVIGSEKRRKLDNVHVIIIGTQSPVAIRNTIYGADNKFIFVKRSVLRGAALNFFPELLSELSTGSRIVIGIDRTLFLAGEIKCYVADFDVPIT